MFLYVPPPIGDRNTPKILFALLENPLDTIWYLIRIALQDSVIVTFTSWYRTLVPELFSFATFFNRSQAPPSSTSRTETQSVSGSPVNVSAAIA